MLVRALGVGLTGARGRARREGAWYAAARPGCGVGGADACGRRVAGAGEAWLRGDSVLLLWVWMRS